MLSRFLLVVLCVAIFVAGAQESRGLDLTRTAQTTLVPVDTASRNLTLPSPTVGSSSVAPSANNATVAQSNATVVQTIVSSGQISLVTSIVNATAAPVNNASSTSSTLSLPTASFTGQTTSQTPAPAVGPDDSYIAGDATALFAPLQLAIVVLIAIQLLQ